MNNFDMVRAISSNLGGGITEGFKRSNIDRIMQDAEKDPEMLSKFQQHIQQNYGDTEYGQRAQSILAQKQEQIAKNRIDSQYANIGEQLRKNFPNNPQNSILADIFSAPDISPKLKEQLAKATSGLQPHTETQQRRLKLDSDLRHIDSYIRNLNAQLLKTAPMVLSKQETEEELKKYLRLKKKMVDDMELLNTHIPQPTPEQPIVNQPIQMQSQQQQQQEVEKPVFNIEDPAHQEVVKMLMKKTNGNRAVVNKMIRESFTVQ